MAAAPESDSGPPLSRLVLVVVPVSVTHSRSMTSRSLPLRPGLCAPGKCYWTGAYFAPNGTCEASKSTVGCVAPGIGTPADATGSVTSISLPTTYNPSGYFTCLDFSYTIKGLGYLIFLLSSPASPGTWVQNNIANCAPGPGITP